MPVAFAASSMPPIFIRVVCARRVVSGFAWRIPRCPTMGRIAPAAARRRAAGFATSATPSRRAVPIRVATMNWSKASISPARLACGQCVEITCKPRRFARNAGRPVGANRLSIACSRGRVGMLSPRRPPGAVEQQGSGSGSRAAMPHVSTTITEENHAN